MFYSLDNQILCFTQKYMQNKEIIQSSIGLQLNKTLLYLFIYLFIYPIEVLLVMESPDVKASAFLKSAISESIHFAVK